MTELAKNITRINPAEADPSVYVFATDTVPPRFATVEFRGEAVLMSGPLDQAQLDIELAADDGPIPEEQQAVYNQSPFGYSISYNDLWHEGAYPGGRDQMALNAARFLLGAQ